MIGYIACIHKTGGVTGLLVKEVIGRAHDAAVVYSYKAVSLAVLPISIVGPVIVPFGNEIIASTYLYREL